MLVVLFGVSGAGRTSTIKGLCQDFQWRYIPVYTTRKSRQIENEAKTIVSEEEFADMQTSGDFFCVTNVYHNFYGFPKTDIVEATTDSEGKWIIDFALSNAHMFAKVPFVGVWLRPENHQSIIERLKNTNRAHREYEVLSRLKNDELHAYNSSYIDIIVTNKVGSLDDTIKQIARIELTKFNCIKFGPK